MHSKMELLYQAPNDFDLLLLSLYEFLWGVLFSSAYFA